MRNGVLSEPRSNMLDYASPEEINGKSIGRRSNIYSLGIMLYELLTGHRPELPTSSWDIFEHSTLPKEVPLEEAREGLSGETYRLVRNCLWRQEWSRFETAEEVISAIDTAMLAEQTVPKAAIWPDGRNRWLYFTVPGLAVLVIVIGLVLLWSQFANAEPQGSEATAPADVAGAEKNPEDAGSISEAANSSATEVVPTAIPTVTLTREAPPTSAMDTTIPVFSPLADQVFERGETIGFAWIWFSQPDPDESFTVYIESEDHEIDSIAVGNIDEPDNASLYRLDTNAVELGLTAGSYLWQVRLENPNDESTAVESDSRRFFIAEEPTATPSPTPTDPPPTATETPSVTPTPAPLLPSATVFVCVPQRPFGWVQHRIQAGEFISLFASRANVPTEAILDANCLSRSSVLSIGQLIYVPAPPATATFTPRPTLVPSPTVVTSGGGGGGGGSAEPTSKPSIPIPGG